MCVFMKIFTITLCTTKDLVEDLKFYQKEFSDSRIILYFYLSFYTSMVLQMYMY
jgi:hypothetical protein